jgi:hypothetical protein
MHIFLGEISFSSGARAVPSKAHALCRENTCTQTLCDHSIYTCPNTKAYNMRRFSNPRSTESNRFVWDYWHVPDQYTLVRTSAQDFFGDELYDRCVCMCGCMCVRCVCICYVLCVCVMCVCVYACTYIYCMCMYVCMHVFQSHVHVRIIRWYTHMFTYTHAYVCIRTHIYTYAHTRIEIYIHAYMPTFLRSRSLHT